MSDKSAPRIANAGPKTEARAAPGDYTAQRQLDDRLVESDGRSVSADRSLASDKVAVYRQPRE
jgi:hypothetical protein